MEPKLEGAQCCDKQEVAKVGCSIACQRPGWGFLRCHIDRTLSWSLWGLWSTHMFCCQNVTWGITIGSVNTHVTSCFGFYTFEHCNWQWSLKGLSLSSTSKQFSQAMPHSFMSAMAANNAKQRYCTIQHSRNYATRLSEMRRSPRFRWQWYSLLLYSQLQ